MFNLVASTDKNNKDDDKKWPYRMLIMDHLDQEKLMHYLISYNESAFKNKIMTVLLTRFICMLKTYVNQNISF